MKKTLIALALAALPVASMADVILYGQVKGGVEATFANKDLGKKVEGADKTTTQIVDYGSRIGFKGHEHLNGDLKAIWQVEQKVNIGGVEQGFSTRDSFIGLQGSFGTVKAGYQSTPIKDLNGKLDQWEYDASRGAVDHAPVPAALASADVKAAKYGASGLAFFTRGNDANRRATAISYTTPDMGGFNATAYFSPSDNNGDGKKNRAIYGVGLSYAQPNGGFFADLAGTYVKHSTNNVTTNPAKRGYQALAQVGYETDKVLVGAAYQRSQAVDAQHDVVNEAALSGAYQVDDALRLKATAAYGWGINDKGGKDKSWEDGKYYQGIIGADYALSKRTVLNAQAGYIQFGKKDEKTASGIVGVGMSHKF